MRQSTRMNLHIILVVVGMSLGFVWGRFYFDQSDKPAEARPNTAVGDEDLQQQIVYLIKEIEVLMRPEHIEAFHLLASLGLVCTYIPAAQLKGNVDCALALYQEGFPRHDRRIEVFSDPEEVIKQTTKLIIDGCKLVGDEIPIPCLQFWATESQ